MSGEATAREPVLRHELERAFVVRAGPEVVWDVLWDVKRMVRCVEGCEDAVAIAEGQSYEAGLRKHVGPFSLRVELAIRVVERVAPTRIVLEIDGRDRRLRSRVVQTLTLRLDPDSLCGGTRVSIAAGLEVGGVLASLAKHLVAMHVAESMEQFAAALAAEVERESDFRVLPTARTGV